MESASVFMLATFAASVVLGALTRNNWVAIGLPILIPAAPTVARMHGPGLAETLLFVSPFLVAGLIIYCGVAFGGASLGRKLRKMIFGHSEEED